LNKNLEEKVKLSAKASYTLNILDFAVKANGKFFSLNDLVAAYPLESPPKAFLSVILRNLREADILEGKKGNNGGYKLKIEPSNLDLKKIFSAIGEAPLNYQQDLFASPLTNKFGCELTEYVSKFFERKFSEFGQ
jgi:DNA-binding IscR family transcriptional regulator